MAVDAYALAVLKSLLEDLVGSQTFSFHENFTGDYTKPEGFYLYVGVTGAVNVTDMRGVASTRTFTAGYHPIRISTVLASGTTATNLAACFN